MLNSLTTLVKLSPESARRRPENIPKPHCRNVRDNQPPCILNAAVPVADYMNTSNSRLARQGLREITYEGGGQGNQSDSLRPSCSTNSQHSFTVRGSEQRPTRSCVVVPVINSTTFHNHQEPEMPGVYRYS